MWRCMLPDMLFSNRARRSDAFGEQSRHSAFCRQKLSHLPKLKPGEPKNQSSQNHLSETSMTENAEYRIYSTILSRKIFMQEMYGHIIIYVEHTTFANACKCLDNCINRKIGGGLG